MLLNDILELNALRDPQRRRSSAPACRTRSATCATGPSGWAPRSDDLAAPGDRVAILAENVVEYVDAYYGVPAARMALVFLNYRLNPHELAWILDDAGAKVLLVDRDYLDAHARRARRVAGRRAHRRHRRRRRTACRARSATTSSSPPVPDPAPAGRRPREDDVAWQLYTSGTTGRPKGAMLTHRSLITALHNAAMAYDVKADDRTLLCFPMCHVAGYLVTLAHMAGDGGRCGPTTRRRSCTSSTSTA